MKAKLDSSFQKIRLIELYIRNVGANLSFYLVEAYSRMRLVRILFPDGKLAKISGTVKFSILGRIRMLYSVGTLAPMIILVGTLFNAFNVFLGDRAPEDDVTLVVIKITKTSVLNFVFGV